MLPPLRNTHMTTVTYYACIVYVRRYAAAELSEPMTFVQRSVSRGRATLELEFWHRRIPTLLLGHQAVESTCAAAKLRSKR